MQQNLKGFVQLIIPIILAVIVVAGLGYLALKNGQLKLPISDSPLSSSSAPLQPKTDRPPDEISPTPMVNQVSTGDLTNWKTYTNDNEKFTISFPHDWYLGGEDWWHMWLKSNKQQYISIKYNIISPYKTNKTDPFDIIEIDKNYYLGSTSFSDCGGKQLDKKITSINGYKAVRYLLQPIDCTNGPSGDRRIWVYVIRPDNYILQLEFESKENSSIFDQILSTFYFSK